MRIALPYLLLLALAGCHGFKGTAFPASYRHMGEEAATASPCAGLSKVVVKDARADVGLVGARSREDASGSMPIRMEGDVSGWVREGFESVARKSGLSVGPARFPSMELTVKSIDLQEKVDGNADYKARMVLEVAVLLPNGQSCFVSSYEGEAKNFGRAASTDNYQETINHALETATVKVLNAVPVREAMCGTCANPGPVPAAPTPVPVQISPL